MRLLYLPAILGLLCSTASGQEPIVEMALGESLVSALVREDMVAYSNCWMPSRRIMVLAKQLGIEQSEDEQREFVEYWRLRNKDIAESFSKIQQLIDSRDIDRKSIRLKSCEAIPEREKRMPNPKRATMFTLVLLVDGEEWKYTIDDGMLEGDLWYFTDSPLNLVAGKTTLSFRDHRSEAAVE